MLMHSRRRFRAALIAVTLIAQSLMVAYAGTLATINGSVNDDSGHPIANVAVVAKSPSGRYFAKTDSHGFYSITGVVPDTYAVSFEAGGFDSQTILGVSAFADQTARVDLHLAKSLKTIARVTSRSTSGAFQPGQTADTYSVNAAQIQAIQGNALNISQKNLIRAMPGAGYTVGDAPTIRGGRSNNVDYEVDGVPFINPYTNANVNNYTMPSFGFQAVQVSPGDEDASFGNSGVGTINSTLRRGSYPGEFDFISGVGAPNFYHALGAGWGIAARNGSWSNYASYTAGNTAPRYGGNLEPNSTLNGSYGDIQLIQDREFTNNFVLNFGKDNKYDVQWFVDNGWHNRAAGYGMGPDYNVEVTSAGGTYIAPMCYATCNPAWTSYFGDDTAAGKQIYPYWCSSASTPASQYRCGDWTGLTVQQFQAMVPNYPGQTGTNQTLGGRPYYQEFDSNSAQKFAFDYRPDASTVATLTYYNTFSQHISDSISIYPFESGDVWNLQGGYEHAFKLDITRQLNAANQLKIGGEAYADKPVLQTISPLTALFNPLFNGNFEYLDFIRPGEQCPGQNGVPLPGSVFYPTYNNTYSTNSCGWLYTQPQFANAGQLMPPPAVNGNQLEPTGSAIYIDDKFQPNARLKTQVGLRVEYRNNHLPAPVVNPDCTTTYLPLQWNVYPANVYAPDGTLLHGQNFDPNTGLFNGQMMGPGNCPTAVFEPVTKAQSNPTTFEPRTAFSYLLTPNDLVRFSWGITSRYPNLVFSDAGVSQAQYAQFAGLPAYMNNSSIIPFQATPFQLTANSQNNPYTQRGIPTSCGMVSYGIAVPCTSYQEQLYWNGWNGNFGKPLMPLAPITYSNFDFTFAHQFKGGWELKATPWSRRAYNLDVTSEVINPYSTPHLNADGTKSYAYFGLLSNAGLEKGSGVEAYLTKLTPWHGFTGFISASWQHVVQNIDPANTPAGLSRDVTGVANNENNGAISAASAAFGGLYRVNYVSPFVSSLNLQYETRGGGWRISTQWFYDAGYPYGQGVNVIQLYGGTPKIVPQSNDCTNLASPQNAFQYSDPTNPGSCLAPHIVATRGTDEGNFANQKLSHPNLTAALTLEKNVGAGRIGFTINNLFNEIYTGLTQPNGIDYGKTGPILSTSYGFDARPGMQLNPAYQPVATGVSGPLSGINPAGGAPQGYGALICGTCAYIHYPNGEGRSYYVYYTVKVGGSHP